MKCPYCGSEMQITQQNFVCPNCKVILQPIADADAPVQNLWRNPVKQEQETTQMQPVAQEEPEVVEQKPQKKADKKVAKQPKSRAHKLTGKKLAPSIMLIIVSVVMFALAFCPAIKADSDTVFAQLGVSADQISGVNIGYSTYDYIDWMIALATQPTEEDIDAVEEDSAKALAGFMQSVQDDYDAQTGRLKLSTKSNMLLNKFIKLSTKLTYMNMEVKDSSEASFVLVAGILSCIYILVATIMLGIAIGMIVLLCVGGETKKATIALASFIPLALVVVLTFALHATSIALMTFAICSIVAVAVLAGATVGVFVFGLLSIPRKSIKLAIPKIVGAVCTIAVVCLAFAPAFAVATEFKHVDGENGSVKKLYNIDFSVETVWHGVNGVMQGEVFAQQVKELFNETEFTQEELDSIMMQSTMQNLFMISSLVGAGYAENESFVMFNEDMEWFVSVYYAVLLVGLLCAVTVAVLTASIFKNKKSGASIALRVFVLIIVLAILAGCSANVALANYALDASGVKDSGVTFAVNGGVIAMALASILALMLDGILTKVIKKKQSREEDCEYFVEAEIIADDDAECKQAIA